MCILNDSSMRLKMENRLKAQELLWDKIVKGDRNMGKMVKVSGKSTNASMSVCDLTAVSTLIWWVVLRAYTVAIVCTSCIFVHWHWLIWLKFWECVTKSSVRWHFLHTSIPNFSMQFVWCSKFETIIWYSKISMKTLFFIKKALMPLDFQFAQYFIIRQFIYAVYFYKFQN